MTWGKGTKQRVNDEIRAPSFRGSSLVFQLGGEC